MSRIGEQKYNLLFNNCEHFANWCKTGRHRSLQMEELFNKGSKGASLLGRIVPSALLGGLKIIVGHGLIDAESRQIAMRGIDQLDKAKDQLLKQLELSLEKIENWLERNPSSTKIKKENMTTKRLLLAGQQIADEINAIDNLKVKINNVLLNSPDDQS